MGATRGGARGCAGARTSAAGSQRDAMQRCRPIARRSRSAMKIADEAARAARPPARSSWHEQMISLTTQNRDMRAKNQELSAIVAHVSIVSLNASIGPRAPARGAASRSSRAMRRLAARSQQLSNSYRDSLNRNDLVTAATFQDIQAGGKMITAALATVETLAGQLHARIEGGAA